MVASLCLVCATACFGSRSSQGGGEISAGRAKAAAAAAESPYDVVVPPGYRIELVAQDLSFPTGVAIGEGGELYVVESGYSYGEVFTRPRLLVLEDGKPRELATGEHAPWTGVAVADGSLFVAQGGAVDGGRIVRFPAGGGEGKVLVDGLPSLGDHHTNGPAVKDGWVYFGQGAATNAGVVGPDNADFGWLARQPTFHDIPCQDITLVGTSFESDDVVTPTRGKVSTGAYLPFGQPARAGQRIPGKVPCTGAIMRVPVDGGPPELVAWGLRNPFGLAFGPDGSLYATDNGYDVRGSRPVFGSADMLWKIEQDGWYGWPDYSEGRPLTWKFYQEDDGEPKGFMLAEHPRKPPDPVAYLGVHSSADGVDFSRSARFGHEGQAFIALFGDMAPGAGKVLGPVGFKVVRVDLATGDVEDFARNRGDESGPSSRKKLRGLERPVAVRFDPTGEALYVVDFGILRMDGKKPRPEPGTGALWRITRSVSR